MLVAVVKKVAPGLLVLLAAAVYVLGAVTVALSICGSVAAAGLTAYLLLLLPARAQIRKALADGQAPPTTPSPILLPWWQMIRSSEFKDVLSLRTNKVMEAYRVEYGPIYRTFAGGMPLVVVSGKEAANDVLSQQADTFRNRLPPRNGIEYFLPEGLLGLQSGKQWATHRRLIVGLFTRKHMQGYVSHFCSHTNTLTDLWEERGKETMDVHRAMVVLTLDIIGTTVLDLEFGAVTDEARADSILARMKSGLMKAQLMMLLMKLPPFLRRLVPKGEEPYVKKLMAEKLQQEADDTRETQSMAELLREARDDCEDGRALTDSEIRDELITFMAAGHETTANTLGFALHLLATHPEVQAKARAEAGSPDAADLSLDDIEGMPYITGVILEALRIYPVVPVWPRYASADANVSGYTVRKGEIVAINNVGLSRDDRVFPDPTRFDPSRWVGDLASAEGDPSRGWLPFGGGGRICPGRRFALVEGTTVLALLLRRFDFQPHPELTPSHPIKDIVVRITQQPRNGIVLRVKKL